MAQTLVPVGVFSEYPSEIPLLQRVGEQILVAWTDGSGHRVRLVRLPLGLGGDRPAVATVLPL
ncbi:MAG: hypothetical protein ACREYE_06515 [Gammaproteobacteria bacterium]